MKRHAAIAKRFWRKVKKIGKCWLWTASTFEDGYGKFWLDGRNHPAQRIARWLSTGRWPKRYVLHRCDRPGCVRPSHLFEGDAGTNARDREAKGRSQSIAGDLNPSRRYPERLPRGEKHAFAKLTAAKVREIRRRAAAGEKQNALAQEFGVSNSNLCNIVNYKTWRRT